MIVDAGDGRSEPLLSQFGIAPQRENPRNTESNGSKKVNYQTFSTFAVWVTMTA
jgi:hypothetical protein